MPIGASELPKRLLLLSKPESNALDNDEGPGLRLLFGALTRAFGEWAILGSNQ